MTAALLLAHLRTDGVCEKTYRLPDGSKRTIFDIKVPEDKTRMTLIGQMWDELDRVTEPLAQGQGTDYDKGYARGVAAMLAMFMVPHFTTADEIVREAVKRYKAKAAGEEYETPGLGSRRMEPPPGSESKYKVPATAKPYTRKVEVKLGEQQQKAIKFAKESGMFTVEVLAKTYGVSVAVINQICSA